MSRSSNVLSIALACLIGAQVVSAAPITATGFTTTAGLDLAGNIILAENTGGPAVSNVGGVNFSAYSGTYFVGSGVADSLNAGFSQAALDDVMADFRYFINPTTLTANIPVTAGSEYKLQLLFREPDNTFWATGRNTTVSIEAETPFTFNAVTVAGAPGGVNGKGAVVTYDYVAGDSTLNVIISSTQNGTLAGFTLEQVPEPGSASLLCLGGIVLAAARRRTSRRSGC